MTIYNTADNVNDFKKKGTNNDDFYYIDNEKVQIIEESNGGEDTVYSTLNYTLGNNIENLTLTTMLDAEKIVIPNSNGEIGYLYGHPAKYTLDSCQGNNYVLDSKNNVISGTCGIVAVKNILIQAGKLEEDPLNLVQNNVMYKDGQYIITYFDPELNKVIEYTIEKENLASRLGFNPTTINT